MCKMLAQIYDIINREKKQRITFTDRSDKK